MPNMPLVQQLAGLQAQGTQQQGNAEERKRLRELIKEQIENANLLKKLRDIVSNYDVAESGSGTQISPDSMSALGHSMEAAKTDSLAIDRELTELQKKLEPPQPEPGPEFAGYGAEAEPELGDTPTYEPGPEPDLSVMQKIQNALSEGHPYATPEYRQWEYDTRRQEEELKKFLDSLGG
ncbi:unnamed protein product [marine sediment metagenome]|uniref:Uncharacterized protein n=1 Tax=marine sediment metagenome TaxID=412755 RepID=X0U4B6_9ZZZZ